MNIPNFYLSLPFYIHKPVNTKKTYLSIYLPLNPGIHSPPLPENKYEIDIVIDIVIVIVRYNIIQNTHIHSQFLLPKPSN